MTYRVSDNTKRRFSDMIWHIGGIAILGLLVAVWGRLHGPWSEGQKAEQIQELGSHFAPIEAVQRIEGAVKTMAESVESMDEKHDQWYHEFEEKRSNFITKTNTAIQNLQASQSNHSQDYNGHYPKSSVVGIEAHERDIAIMQNQFTSINVVLTDLKKSLDRIESLQMEQLNHNHQ